jgi:hypothetical protein
MISSQKSQSPKRVKSVTIESFRPTLDRLVGMTVTIVDPERFEPGPVGFQMTTSHYRAKVVKADDECVVTVHQEVIPRGKHKGEKEAVTQWIRLERIKRIAISKSRKLLHL